MNDEKRNVEFYQNAFDEIHASEDLLRKVLCMKNEKGLKRIKRTLKAGYVAAAVLVIAFFSSNIISYAATGDMWISEWIGKITVIIDGEEKEADITEFVDEDGNTWYKVEMEADTTE